MAKKIKDNECRDISPVNNNIDWDNVNWHDLIKRLTIVSIKILRKKSWYGRKYGSIACGKTAEDFVSDAIIKTLTNIRTFDGKDISLYEHLCGVISSEIYHLSMSIENRNTKIYEENFPNKYNDENEHNKSPESLLINKDFDMLILEEIAYDSESRLVLEIMLKYKFSSPANISRVTGLQIEKIYNIKKKLRRRLIHTRVLSFKSLDKASSEEKK